MKQLSHLALIMDGNGRWAREKGLGRARGHIAGARVAFEIISSVARSGISSLSLFAFSAENWKRPPAEVRALMRLLAHALIEKLDFFNDFKIKLKVIGEREGLPETVLRAIERAELVTEKNRGLNLLLAVNYSGQNDICQAVRKLKQLRKITPAQIGEALHTAEYGNPDLIIRTGGENRLSNFFLWQAAYAEIHFQEKYWPDFTEADLKKHLDHFGKTERRFGRTAD